MIFLPPPAPCCTGSVHARIVDRPTYHIICQTGHGSGLAGHADRSHIRSLHSASHCAGAGNTHTCGRPTTQTSQADPGRDHCSTGQAVRNWNRIPHPASRRAGYACTHTYDHQTGRTDQAGHGHAPSSQAVSSCDQAILLATQHTNAARACGRLAGHSRALLLELRRAWPQPGPCPSFPQMTSILIIKSLTYLPTYPSWTCISTCVWGKGVQYK